MQNLKDLEERLCNMGLPGQWTEVPTDETVKAIIKTGCKFSDLAIGT